MSDKSNKYGYVGVDIPAQSFGSNKGVFNPAEINELVANNKWTSFGQLELIHTETFSGVSYVDFLQSAGTFDTSYNVHFLTINNLQPTSNNNFIGMQFFESGTLENASVYQYAKQLIYVGAGTVVEYKSTGATYIQVGHATGNATNEKQGIYAYMYNLADSSKYSFVTCHSSTLNGSLEFGSEFGSGVLPQISTVNGFRIIPNISGNISGTISLYGIRYS